MKVYQEFPNGFVDLTLADTVEIRISADGKKLWIDTEHGNVCRIYNIKTLVLTDQRVQEMPI